ncbi:hypothetical protein BH11VER1_BH11VER1_01190 [soil metagenome]
MKTTKLIALLALTLFSVSLTHAADSDKKTTTVPTTYPLKKCVISGDVLGGEMGKPIKVTSEGTDVYLCCKSCIKDFNKDPAKYVKMVKDAEAAAKK